MAFRAAAAAAAPFAAAAAVARWAQCNVQPLHAVRTGAALCARRGVRSAGRHSVGSAARRYSCKATKHVATVSEAPAQPAAERVPTTILGRIKEGEKQAAKKNDAVRLSALRSLLADIAEAEKRRYPPRKINCDSDVVHLIHKALARRNEAVALYRDGGREDLAVAEEAVVAIVKELLPPTLTTNEVDELVLQTCLDIDAKQFKDFNRVLRNVPISPTRAPKAAVITAATRYIENPEKYGLC